jgi:2-iminobutanoate/2-iminopropanoate deaminase
MGPEPIREETTLKREIIRV